jgi:hypothetical protein
MIYKVHGYEFPTYQSPSLVCVHHKHKHDKRNMTVEFIIKMYKVKHDRCYSKYNSMIRISIHQQGNNMNLRIQQTHFDYGMPLLIKSS